MAARKRIQTNTVEGAKIAIAAITTKFEPPMKLTDAERVIFDDIVVAREAATWHKHDLRVAAHLAKNLLRMEELQASIDATGYTTTNNRGTVVGNPEVNILLQITATCGQLNRQLGLSANQRGLAGEDQGKRNAADRKARDVIEKALEDDLI